MRNILILNGPNLNLLGTREPEIYGSQTIYDLEDLLFQNRFGEDKFDFRQSNSEGGLIDILHEANKNFDGVIFNPAAYTHTSVAIYDAIKAISIPVVEVHISNIHSREDFRKNLITTGACIGQISGFGFFSYVLGYKALSDYLNKGK